MTDPRPLDRPRLPQPDPTRSRLRFWLAWWLGLSALWLLFVDTLAPVEIAAGVIAAAIAASVAEAVRESGYVRFAPRAHWLTEVPSVAWGILVDTVVLGAALWRRVVQRRPGHGAIIRLPFHHGDEGGQDAARRALFNLAVSVTPNTFVIDFESDSVLIHQHVPGRFDRILSREMQRAEEHPLR